MKRIVLLAASLLFFAGANAQCHLSISVLPSSSCLSGHDTLRVSGAGNTSQLIWTSGASTLYTALGAQIDTVLVVAGTGGLGSTANQLNGPEDMYIDPNGNIYVCDETNNRIQKFPAGSVSGTNAVTVAGGNGAGNAANQLNDPRGLYVDAAGDIYVADSHNHRIQKFPAGSTSATNAVTVAGGNGSGSAANKLSYPQDVYLDLSGNIYVVDGNNFRIQMFPAGSTSATSGTTIAGGTPGPGLDALSQPISLLVDNSGNVYVLDQTGERVVMFPPGSSAGTSGTVIAGNNGGGSGANQFYIPRGIFFDVNGNLYVADQGNNRIQKFLAGSTSATNGTTLHPTTVGSAPGQFNSPAAVYVDASGNLYEEDAGNGRIQEFTSIEVNNDTTFVLSAPGIYTVIATHDGCNDTSTAIIYPASIQNNTYTYCDSGTVVVGSHIYTSSGTYTDTLPGASVHGCDSLVTTTLIINPMPNPTINRNNNILSTQPYASYQWLLNGQPIPNATSQNFTVTQSGSYSVVVTNAQSCADTSATTFVAPLGIGYVKNIDSVSISPNPSMGKIHVSMGNSGMGLIIYDVMGRAVYGKQDMPSEDDVDLQYLPKGIYTVIINGNGRQGSRRLILQ